MGVFHVFEIVQMVPNQAKRHIKRMLLFFVAQILDLLAYLKRRLTMKWLLDDSLDIQPGSRSSPNEDIIKFKVFIGYFRYVEQPKLLLNLAD